MSSPVNPWPGSAPPGPFARQFIRALWAEVSAYSDGIAAEDTVEVYGVTYTCVSVGTGKWGQIVLTDPKGFGWSVPNYASPVLPYTSVINYNAAENTGS